MMALQEHSLYEDTAGRSVYDKSAAAASAANAGGLMYLDLKRSKPPILNTPDVSVFALSTPEVHNLLSSATVAASNTSVTSVSDPSRYIGRHEHHHHPVTLEQEFYARGFLDRLEALQANDLHAKSLTDNLGNASSISHYSTSAGYGSNPSLEAVAPTYVTATLDHIPNFATTTRTTSESTTAYPVSSQHDAYYSEAYTLPYPRHEIPAYPTLATTGVTVAQPMYGVMDAHVGHDVLKEMAMVPDMHTQEQMKVERKKARNRIAASKCRTRRLQRESELEGKVRLLKDRNKELNDEVNGLREQISNLKKALTQHVQTGCQVSVPASESS